MDKKNSLLVAGGLALSLLSGEVSAKQARTNACDQVDHLDMQEVTSCARKQLSHIKLPQGTIGLTVFHPNGEMYNVLLERETIKKRNKCGIQEDTSEYSPLEPTNIDIQLVEADGASSQFKASHGFVPVALKWKGIKKGKISVTTPYNAVLGTNAAVMGGYRFLEQKADAALATLKSVPSQAYDNKSIYYTINKHRLETLGPAIAVIEHIDVAKLKGCNNSALSPEEFQRAMNQQIRQVLTYYYYNRDEAYANSISTADAFGPMQITQEAVDRLTGKLYRGLSVDVQDFDGGMQFAYVHLDSEFLGIENISERAFIAGYNSHADKVDRRMKRNTFPEETKWYLKKFEGFKKWRDSVMYRVSEGAKKIIGRAEEKKSGKKRK